MVESIIGSPSGPDSRSIIKSPRIPLIGKVPFLRRRKKNSAGSSRTHSCLCFLQNQIPDSRPRRSSHTIAEGMSAPQQHSKETRQSGVPEINFIDKASRGSNLATGITNYNPFPRREIPDFSVGVTFLPGQVYPVRKRCPPPHSSPSG